MKFLLPIRTNPATGRREINGTFIMIAVMGCAAYFFYAFFNKETDQVITNAKAGTGVQEQSDQVFLEGQDMSAINARDAEIQKIRDNRTGTDPAEAARLEKEVRERYAKEAELIAKADGPVTDYDDRLSKFLTPPETPAEKERQENVETTAPEAYTGWVPYSVRKQKGEAQQATKQGVSKGYAKTESEKNVPDPVDPTTPEVVRAYNSALNFDEAEGDQNFLPLGTYIPVVLLEDIVTNDLQQYVTVSVAQDVTFRKRLQLPKGAVMLRGKVGKEPVQDVVDVHFDVMIFADGTELPCSGIACSALDIRTPDRFRTRGIPGEVVTPPLYTKAKALYYTAIAGGLKSYLEDSSAQGPSSQGFGQITINPPAGSGNYQDYFGGRNPDYIQRAIVSGTKDTIDLIKDDLQSDMDKYRPYLKVEKGTPLFIQLEQTVNLNARAVNGLAKAQERERQIINQGGVAYANNQTYYPPGDARANQNPLVNPQLSARAGPVLQLPPGVSNQGGTDALDTQLRMKQLELINQAQQRMRDRDNRNIPPAQ